ncbi:hypothetical protein FS837_008092 [Tulasnella sp. UAMH 9824]|nr:hypothetical protein FS837_008092 [Tulasnella sp. UAMH 9824]
MYFCKISGEPPQEPVVSSKSGEIYERRLILKYIQENGTEPATGEKLEETDLITLKANPKSSAPRPPSATSIPALLHTLQNEWDSLMLEFYTLNQQHQATRQELSNALYQQDAATRVIARLIKERDAARDALASVQATTGLSTTQDVDMAEAPSESALPADVMSTIEETNSSLSSVRKKRKPPTDYAKPESVKAYQSIHTIPSLHASSPAGITSISLSTANPTQFLTGGNDKTVQLYDREAGKVLATLKGHTKRINHVKLRERDGENTLVVSGSADKTVRVWSHDSASGDFAPASTFKTHKGEITGLDLHPSGKYLAVGSADKTWSLQSLETFQTLFHAAAGNEPYASLALHPDGCLLALGTLSSTIQIYDIRSQSFVASLGSEEAATPFAVNTLSFSENGYHLAAPDGTSSVAIWDLRKQKTVTSINLSTTDANATYKINRIRYDPSAQWFGVAGNHDARIIAHKTWEELVRFEEGGEVVDLAFGGLGKEVWGVSGREVRIWGSA